MRLASVLVIGALTVVGCAVDDPIVDKDDIASGKADGGDVCVSLGLEPGCDLCAEMGWYDDDVCDEFCDRADPDCGAVADEVTFECMGVRSGTFFDLTIVDVGDEEGLVHVDDGGAPRSFAAQYDELQPVNGWESHRFVFGFDEHAAGEIDDLYSIEITNVSYAFLRGTAAYEGEADEVVCYAMSALAPPADAPSFECLSVEGNTLFDLDIVDVGDEEGTVVVNDGGAPVTYAAEYDELEAIGGNARHGFVFGFDELAAGEIEELYGAVVEERSINFATGRVDYAGSSDIVCHIGG